MMDFPTQCVVVVNQALKDNPAMNELAIYRSPLNALLARPIVQGWLGEGIPESVILGALQDASRRFQPAKSNPTIRSLKYFDAAVHRKWEESKQGASVEGGLAEAFRKLSEAL